MEGEELGDFHSMFPSQRRVINKAGKGHGNVADRQPCMGSDVLGSEGTGLY